MKNILVLNGPNLNMLGIREPNIYGKQDYPTLVAFIQEAAAKLGLTVDVRQSNHEGVLVDWIQEALGKFDGIVINPAAYTCPPSKSISAMSPHGSRSARFPTPAWPAARHSRGTALTAIVLPSNILQPYKPLQASPQTRVVRHASLNLLDHDGNAWRPHVWIRIDCIINRPS